MTNDYLIKNNHFPAGIEKEIFPEVCSQCQEWYPKSQHMGRCDINGKLRKSYTVACPIDRDKIQDGLLIKSLNGNRQAYEDYGKFIHDRMFIYYD